jgi:hypothetical protein
LGAEVDLSYWTAPPAFLAVILSRFSVNFGKVSSDPVGYSFSLSNEVTSFHYF